ncbi:uncharacterized protein TRIADDRAFT_60256 [Trichoplax adhaerens]|uniref:ERAD-associated E3 ubiquitin-protein ligase component HRD3A n=1 Tax=Trichoplax adhaerens TaxID=10228 RepID=B3S7Q7_TRIAD|nr:hypothetical protein TRIADDRAFT_60256 [Trichoplax adhaerens]EDV21237.1 hypothetical protein TRIADDRAFT_60256 [Trichoplax adhaerens]|eukprot:XP_002116204.1 hypothetical protein TRIADDRAFT_60256 [Trichoplax adhaerens]
MDTMSTVSSATISRSQSGILDSQSNPLLDRYLNKNYINDLMNNVFQHYLFLSETDSNSHIHFQLGYIYHHGFGSVPKNLNKAFYHYQLASDAKHPAAQYMLYKLYGSDPAKSDCYVRIVSEDELVDLKVRTYVKSAAQDNHYCKANLTLWKAYRKSQLWHDIINRAVERYKQILTDVSEGRRTMETDQLAETYNEIGYLTVQLNLNNSASIYRRAMDYFTRACQLGNGAAYFNVGCMMYHNSFGVKRDELKIQEYCLKAAERHHPRALYVLARQKLNPRINCEDDCLLAYSYLRDSCTYRYSSTLLELGYVYLMGIGGQMKNFNIARQFFEEAAVAFDYTDSFGNIRAFHVLGYMYEQGLGCDIDYSRSACYYAYAARKNSYESYCKLAKLIEKNRIPSRDVNDAIQLYQLAIDASYHAVGYANYRLGKLYCREGAAYYDDRLACKHFVEAFRYYDEAVRQKEPTAGQCYHIGVMYQYGYGVKADGGKAIDFYRLAMNCAGLTYNILDKWYGKKAKRQYDQYLTRQDHANQEENGQDDRHNSNYNSDRPNRPILSAFTDAAEMRQSLNDLDGFRLDSKGLQVEQIELLPLLSLYDQCENLSTDPSEIPSILDEKLTTEFQSLAADNLQVKDIFLEGYIQLLKEEIVNLDNQQRNIDTAIENLKTNLTSDERDTSQELARLIQESEDYTKIRNDKMKKISNLQHVQNYPPLCTFYHSCRLSLIKALLIPSLERLDTSGEIFFDPTVNMELKTISSQLLLSDNNSPSLAKKLTASPTPSSSSAAAASSSSTHRHRLSHPSRQERLKITRIGLQRVEKIADKIARMLTLSYENQLLCVTSCGAKLLGQCALEFVQCYLPHQYDQSEPLPASVVEFDEWIIHTFIQGITANNHETEQTLPVSNRRVPCVVMGTEWTVYGVFKKPSLMTSDGDYFATSTSDPAKYGYRYVNRKELEQIKLQTQEIEVTITTPASTTLSSSSSTSVDLSLAVQEQSTTTTSSNQLLATPTTVQEMSTSRILARENDLLNQQVCELMNEVQKLKKSAYNAQDDVDASNESQQLTSNDKILQPLLQEVKQLRSDVNLLKKILISKASSDEQQDLANLVRELALTRSDTAETLSGMFLFCLL